MATGRSAPSASSTRTTSRPRRPSRSWRRGRSTTCRTVATSWDERPDRPCYGPGSAAARSGRQRYFLARLPWFDGLVLNASRPLFADVRLRRAVNYALDRKALAAAFGDEPNDQIVPPGVPGFQPGGSYPIDGPDLRVARRLAGQARRAELWYCLNGVSGVRDSARSLRWCDRSLRGSDHGSIATSNCDIDRRYDAVSRRADLIMFSNGSGERDRWRFWTERSPTAPTGQCWARARRTTARSGSESKQHARFEASPVSRATTLVHELMRAAPFAIYGSFVSPEYFSPRVGCKLFLPAHAFVDLGALCAPVAASSLSTT